MQATKICGDTRWVVIRSPVMIPGPTDFSSDRSQRDGADFRKSKLISSSYGRVSCFTLVSGWLHAPHLRRCQGCFQVFPSSAEPCPSRKRRVAGQLARCPFDASYASSTLPFTRLLFMGPPPWVRLDQLRRRRRNASPAPRSKVMWLLVLLRDVDCSISGRESVSREHRFEQVGFPTVVTGR